MSDTGEIELGRDKRAALLISVLALCLALAETGAKSMQTDAITLNVETTNTWAFYQARTIRQTTLNTAIEQAEATKAALPDPAARAALEAQQQAWRATVARWEDDPAGGEGRRQLFDRARATEAARTAALAKYHMFELAAAAFQVAIVVVSASVVTGVSLLALAGLLIGLAGATLGTLGLVAPHLIPL